PRGDAQQEVACVDGVGEVVVGAGLGGVFDVAGLVQGGDHEDGDVLGGGVGAQPLAHLEAADLGHHDVQKHQVGPPLFDQGQGLLAVGGGARLVVALAQVGLEQLHPL